MWYDQEGNPIEIDWSKPEEAKERLSALLDTRSRIVQQDQIGDVYLSTVFLAIDHSFGSGKPVLWETMAWRTVGGERIGEPLGQWRYHSREQALAHHDQLAAEYRDEQEGKHGTRGDTNRPVDG